MCKARVARLAALAVGALLCATVSSQPAADDGVYHRFPGEAVDSRTLETRRQVEELYASGAFERALFIYEKELAPLGDKYAQYMVGYMHLAGQGVAKDRATALAWYRLAAERGETPLLKARDILARTLDRDEAAHANELFVELWQRYGDRKLLLELVARDLRILREHEDSRISDAAPGASISSGYFGADTGEALSQRVRGRLEERMRYLESTNRLEDFGGTDSRAMRRLESEIRQQIEALNLR